MTLNPTTRSSLLLRLRDPRDHEAWVAFVALYEPVVYRTLRAAGLQDADAVDVMQELFLAVSRNADRWRPGAEHGSFRGWLRTVTRNLVVSWVRRNRSRVTTSSLDLDALLDATPAADTPESGEFDLEVRRALFRRAAEQVQAEVQPRTWEAFCDVAVAGVSVAETARKLGMTSGAVRVAKCRTVARLRELVSVWGASE